ncbi:MAG: glycoside hydrolase family 3 C-terminal domain-containing protein [Acidobacteriaceae bacterium]|nr:glycoside hydrolase family 3 C-terminal domain-containing protein [Acidobacteriaceae bacterium]
MNRESIQITTVLLVLGMVGNIFAQSTAPAVTGDIRVERLLQQMTLDEKISLLHGIGEDASTDQGEAGYLQAIPRLGIPSLRLADGPPGVLTRVPSAAPVSTMGLAATFSVDDARANGVLVAHEARAQGMDVVLQPFININRDFRYSRGYNTYGEDPVLTGRIGAAFIRGVQGEGIMAQAKHYIAYDTDGMNVFVDPQALHEIYAAPFADAIEAGVSSIMCSYNKVNGLYSCGNEVTLNRILRQEMGFKGFVTSDWGAIHGTDFIKAGVDMEMPGPLPSTLSTPQFFFDMPLPLAPLEKPGAIKAVDAVPWHLPEEPESDARWPQDSTRPVTDLKRMVQSGALSEDVINRAARRILFQMDRFGLLDGKSKHAITPLDVEATAKIIRKTGEDAAVLLKNEDHILPLSAKSLQSLALIGPGARQTIAAGLTGEKAVGLPEREIGALQALRQLTADAPNVHMNFAIANDMDGTAIPAKYLSHDGSPGLAQSTDAGSSSAGSVAMQIDFTSKRGTALPPDTTVTWRGALTVPSTGDYRLHLQVLGCYANLIVDGRRVAHVGMMWIHGTITQAGQDNILPTTDGLDNFRVELPLSAGPHSIAVEVTPDTSGNPAQVRLAWVTPEERAANYAAAIAAARDSRTAIVFAWSRGRPGFALPGDQDKLIEDVASVNPDTIVVLNVCQPIAMPWLGKVKAVLLMWWPGDEGGWAAADVLLGKTSPAGRLPFTWPRRAEDMPAADPAYPERTGKGVDGKTVFSEGIFVGYRWLDRQGKDPLFAFGFGLSYTQFEYSDLTVQPATGGGADISFKIKNTGEVDSDETPQIYLEAPAKVPGDAQFAKRALAAFTRIHLRAGETQTVQLHIPLRRFQYWSTTREQWVTAAGVRNLDIGSSERNLRLHAILNILK